MIQVNCQSMIHEIDFVLVKHPRDSHRNQATVSRQWRGLNYPAEPDYTAVVREFEQFLSLLRSHNMEIGFLPASDHTGLDSVYAHDPVVVTARGAILCNMGKAARLGEPEAVAAYLQNIGVPILGRIQGEGRLEAGDVLWLDERTLAVGEGYRTNSEGICQLRALLGDTVDRVVPVALPHWTGPNDCLHLLSFISPVNHDLAVVYSRLMPVPFRNWLLRRGMRFIEVPDEEFETMACNVLAVAPGHCIMLAGNPVTQARLEIAGVQVATFAGHDLCLKGGGGPTCLTRPLHRNSRRDPYHHRYGPPREDRRAGES